MPGKGFVQDELDLKVLILYIAARVIEPVPRKYKPAPYP